MGTEMEYINGMNLGIGFNTATNEIHPSSALSQIDKFQTIHGAGGQEVIYRVELASSTESITEKMNVSARASLKYGMTASGSARTTFCSLFKQNSYTVYVIVQVTVTNTQSLLDLSAATLKPEAANLYKSDNNSFIQQYGDSFIYGLITGGEFIGVLEIESSSASDLQDIRASLSGQATYGLFSGEAKATFQQSLEKITTNYKLKATVYRQGATGSLGATTPEQLVKDSLEFPEKVSGENGFPRSVLVVPYSHIPHEDTLALDVSLQKSCLERLGGLYQRFSKYQNDLTFAIDHQEQFPDINLDLINLRYNQINDQLNNIKNGASESFNNPSKCTLPNVDLRLLENILPVQIKNIPNLGSTWLEQEAGWLGIWTRRGLSNIFDAKWSKPDETDHTAVLTVHRDGNSIMIIRKENENDEITACTYTGTIFEDGKTIKGFYTCHWINEAKEWSATITF
ncbi:MAC/perforin domain-containing protein [Bacillus halotolerans]|uniref:MAC/perforin domain-containing protein n=1 Tax=Bacillus halotolerans TaxID=260554 RepID=UPI0020CCF2CF|nr:MAC/perforin domain-containing protein [Bacillus halotolerans]MCP9298381.1 MACPF domain-containing protein [Bacillus halotolerans]